jgi:hypothetical protein
MKTFTVLFLLALLFSDNEVIWRTHSTYKKEFCGDQIYFYNDHFLLYEMSCEDDNQLRIGTWEKEEDSVKIKYIDTTFKDFVENISYKKSVATLTSDTIKIYVSDRYERPIRNAMFWTFPKGLTDTLVRKFFMERLSVRQRRNASYRFEEKITKDFSVIFEVPLVRTNENGELFLKKSKVDSLELVISHHLNLQHIRVKIDNQNESITIKMTLPREAFYYSTNHWINYNLPTKFKIFDLKNSKL